MCGYEKPDGMLGGGGSFITLLMGEVCTLVRLQLNLPNRQPGEQQRQMSEGVYQFLSVPCSSPPDTQQPVYCCQAGQCNKVTALRPATAL
jgi:hypothetical protein